MNKYDSDEIGDIEEFDVSAENVNVADFRSAVTICNDISQQIPGSIKVLLLHGPLGPEMIDDIANLYGIAEEGSGHAYEGVIVVPGGCLSTII